MWDVLGFIFLFYMIVWFFQDATDRPHPRTSYLCPHQSGFALV